MIQAIAIVLIIGFNWFPKIKVSCTASMKLAKTATIMKFPSTIFLLLFVAATTSAYSRGSRPHSNDVESDPDMEKYLREALENFREQMKEGIDAINMPRLDPLELRNLDLNINENLASLSLRVKQIVIQDLSQFEVQTVNANLETYFLRLVLILPSVRATGNYTLDGKLLKIFPLNGNGSFSVNLTNADISGHGNLIPQDGTLQIKTLDLDLKWKKLEVYLENFLGGGRFSQVLQRILPNVGKKMFDNFKTDIQRSLNSMLIRNLNQMFKKPEVKKIVEGLIPN